MTKKFNIFNRKPTHGEVIYLPCFTEVGGYIRKNWLQGDKNYCNSKTVLFKDWQSAQAATNFLLKYIKNNPHQFSYIDSSYPSFIYILTLGYFSAPVHQQTFQCYSDIEYLSYSGLVYSTEKEALEAKKELEKALYFEVLRSNPDYVFNLCHPLEDVQFYFPDSYSGRVKPIKFNSINPNHNSLLDRNLLFTDSTAAEEVLQTWLDLPILNNNSRLKED